jgi:hypothetical protein
VFLLSSFLSLSLSLPFFLFSLTHFAATPTDWLTDCLVNQILEFCGPWNERKSQSILMNMPKLILCNGSLSLSLSLYPLWQVQTKSWQIFTSNVNTWLRDFVSETQNWATTITTTTITRRRRRSLLFSDINSSWGTP